MRQSRCSTIPLLLISLFASTNHFQSTSEMPWKGFLTRPAETLSMSCHRLFIRVTCKVIVYLGETSASNTAPFFSIFRPVTSRMRTVLKACLSHRLPLTSFTNRQIKSDIMTTQTVVSLEEHIGALGAKTPIPTYSTANVLVRPLDIGRSYLADLLCGIIEGDTSNAFNSISWPNNIYNGDLVVILPKLSHGSDVEALARSIMQKVRYLSRLIHDLTGLKHSNTKR